MTPEQRENRNKRAREYYEKNKEVLKERNNQRSKDYYKENKDIILSKLNNEDNKKRLKESKTRIDYLEKLGFAKTQKNKI